MALAGTRERGEELRDALARVDDAEAADDEPVAASLRLDVGHRPRGVRDHPDPPVVPGGAGERGDRLGVDDEPRRVLEDERRERELLRAGLPQRRDPLVEDAVREQASDDTVVALHRVEVAVPVATPDRHPGDEVVQHEVVEDDDAGTAAQRVDDPRVRVGVVPDVVEAEVGAARRALPPARAARRASTRRPRAGTRSAE